jgi:hypothetical protein
MDVGFLQLQLRAGSRVSIAERYDEPLVAFV